MARKILNRRELREEADAAERAEDRDEEAEVDTEETEEEEVAVKKKAPAKRKSRAKVPKEVRLKAFWGVFNQSMRRVAVFEFSQKKDAAKKASELSESQRTPHFVQLVKEVIEQ